MKLKPRKRPRIPPTVPANEILGDLLFGDVLRDVRILDVDVRLGQVLSGVVEDLLLELRTHRR